MIKRKILIGEENKEAIEQLLNQAQNKTHVRCFNAEDMITLANEAEAKLNSLGVPKKMRQVSSEAQKSSVFNVRKLRIET